MNTKTWHTPQTTSAFSLVETVMALGIMGLAITALLGLIPHGIEMSKKAGDASAQARIVDTIATRLGNMPFTAIDGQHDERLIFDDQGIQIEGSTAASTGSYVARVRVNSGGSGARLPGADVNQPKLRRVVVQIAATPNLRFNFDAVASRSYQTVPLILGPIIP